MSRRLAVVLALLLPLLATGVLLRDAVAQSECPEGSTSCPGQDGGSGDTGGGDTDGGDTDGGDTDGGDADGGEDGGSGGPCGGGSGGSGGGGGSCEDQGGPDPTRRPAPRPAPDPAPAPAVAPRPPATTDSNGSASGSSSSARSAFAAREPAPSGDPAADAKLAQWARLFGTTPEEVRSWFDPYSANDTIGGRGSGRTLAAGAEYTISNNGAIRDGAAARAFMDMRAGNTVEINLHSTPVRLGSTKTDAQGRFTANVRIPQSTKLGRHFVVALAPNTKQGLVAFVFPITVVDAEPVFNGAIPQSARDGSSSPPWLLIEFIFGTLAIAGLVLFRVRRAAEMRF